MPLQLELTTNNLGSQGKNSVSHRLMDSDLGHHYGLSYSDFPSLRKFYSEYFKYEIEYNQGNVIFLSYYESPESVKHTLTNSIERISIEKCEEDGSLRIMDSLEVLFGKYPWSFNPDDIKAILNKVQVKNGTHDLSLIIDTAPFYHCCKPKEPFGTNFLRHIWKGICLYNKRDMSRVLPKDQKDLLNLYHKGQFTVNDIAA